MRVIELMTRPAVVCGDHETLNTAARKMWEHDCGALPVIGADRRLIGMLTDRDICMAAYTQGTALHEVRVSNAMATRVVSCRPEDDVEQAELRMRTAQVRRLPVIDADGRVLGVISLNDLIRRAAPGGDPELLQTLAAVGQPRQRRGLRAA